MCTLHVVISSGLSSGYTDLMSCNNLYIMRSKVISNNGKSHESHFDRNLFISGNMVNNESNQIASDEGNHLSDYIKNSGENSQIQGPYESPGDHAFNEHEDSLDVFHTQEAYKCSNGDLEGVERSKLFYSAMSAEKSTSISRQFNHKNKKVKKISCISNDDVFINKVAIGATNNTRQVTKTSIDEDQPSESRGCNKFYVNPGNFVTGVGKKTYEESTVQDIRDDASVVKNETYIAPKENCEKSVTYNSAGSRDSAIFRRLTSGDRNVMLPNVSNLTTTPKIVENFEDSDVDNNFVVNSICSVPVEWCKSNFKKFRKHIRETINSDTAENHGSWQLMDKLSRIGYHLPTLDTCRTSSKCNKSLIFNQPK